MSAIKKSGAAVVGLRKPCEEWIPHVTRMSEECFRAGERRDALALVQLASTLATAVQLIELVAPRLLRDNAEAFGMPEPPTQ